ncbi:hypothetical protein BHV42_05075 [Candidatus Melainabacteria bacterium MEL.A1]|jgi:hypothetical protein|nr:hypothetical protein BHV42_05075 [Candidatus Melainabacteria bacterium MEL.A1]CCX80420.1 unknown [Clostridium sp. CAG:715]DAA81043.1 MAG TPA: hypothetical protein CPT82_08455 [Candidatus Gastranaerophilales bacterium HUM_2]
MKDKILNALLIIVLILLVVEVATQEPENRYEVISGNNNVTILLDKQSGQTWRNCICGEKSNVPGCWEKMITINPENFNKPTGEARAMKKMMALQKKQAKLQEKMNNNQPPQQAPQGQNEPLRIGG